MAAAATPDIGDFITVPEIAKELGVSYNTVHNWLRYHRYMNFTHKLGRPVVLRTDYAAFKQTRPDLQKTAA